MHADGLERTRQEGVSLGPNHFLVTRDGDDGMLPMTPTRITEGVADHRVGISREAGGYRSGSGRQSTREGPT